MRKNTIQSISEQTGYSVSTVSRVLSGKAQRSRISQKAIEIIQAEAKRINYTPNLLAQGLRTSRTYTIGLTVPGIDNPFFATLASTVIENLKLAGYHTLLADSLENEKDFESSLMMFRSRSVDGIIAVPVGNTTELMDEITGNIPTVLIDRYFEGTSLPYICTDNYAGGYMATEYLINRGCRNILSIQGVEGSTPSMERVRGFKDAISAHSEKQIEYAIVGDAFSVENGYDQVKRIFSDGVRYDAVFAYFINHPAWCHPRFPRAWREDSGAGGHHFFRQQRFPGLFGSRHHPHRATPLGNRPPGLPGPDRHH